VAPTISFLGRIIRRRRHQLVDAQLMLLCGQVTAYVRVPADAGTLSRLDTGKLCCEISQLETV